MEKCSTDLIRLVFYNPRGFDSFCGKGAAMANHAEFDAFVETIAKLRAPDGCPWDREQTHASIAHNMIEEAYEFAREMHEGQYRKSGEPYIIHPVNVAIILADLGLDDNAIAAGLLHDVVEDTDCSSLDLERKFNEEVAFLVEGVTKLDKIQCHSKEERQLESYRKMFIAMAQDVRVIIIKLADRLHNMRTMSFQSPEKQKRIAQETLEIYSPLADRLGIIKLKWELEDLSLRYLEPEIYYDLVERISMKRQERLEYIDEVIRDLRREMDAVHLEYEIAGRPKHFYSIYRKMVNKH